MDGSVHEWACTYVHIYICVCMEHACVWDNTVLPFVLLTSSGAISGKEPSYLDKSKPE